MKERVKRYIDSLFEDIPDSRQLRELKEEVCANLLERITDSIARGLSEEDAFKSAAAELGDVTELADTMRKAARSMSQSSIIFRLLDRKTALGYALGSASARPARSSA